MIIDQLPEISTVQDTDEIPIERGTTTYKSPLSKIWARLTAAFGSNVLPNMDGTAAIGSSDKYARADHVHPTDTSRASDSELKTYVRPNLLDNWYFAGGGSQGGYGKFPINQRGQTSYSNVGYGIDRWELTSGSVALTSAGITLNGTMRQILPSAIGQTTTASALLSNGTMIVPTYDDSTKTLTLTATGQTIVAVKLEIGSTQTLAHQENGTWVLNEIPNYAEELLKCQRYFVKFQSYQRKRADAVLGTSIDFLFPIPCTMASLPSIIGAPAVHLFGATETEQTGFTISAPGQGGGYVQIRANKSSHGLTDATLFGTSSWYLSCEP